jgi:battenin
VWIVTALQAGNFVLWWFEAAFVFMPIWLEFITMVWVGLMGGASYVNVAYQILSADFLPADYKETAANVSLIFNNLGVILASLFTILLDNTVLKK